MLELIALGPASAEYGQLGPFPGSLGPILRTQCNTLKTCIFLPISIVFWLCWAMLPTLGLSWARLRCQMPPHRTKLRMLSPTCVQKCPQVAPCWSPVGRKLAQVGANWPEFAATAKFDPSRLWFGKVRPLLFPLCPSLWVRAVLVAKRREYLWTSRCGRCPYCGSINLTLCFIILQDLS